MVPTEKIESNFASVRYAHGETDNQLRRARIVEPHFQLLVKGHWYLKECTEKLFVYKKSRILWYLYGRQRRVFEWSVNRFWTVRFSKIRDNNLALEKTVAQNLYITVQRTIDQRTVHALFRKFIETKNHVAGQPLTEIRSPDYNNKIYIFSSWSI